ncbi:hypothetical protein [Sphingomonas sp. HMP6]|uniref:hypothetical protein n=1 Tax=Sphingomonas sp. HMP6 TaxID=1517551 RepID=UPI001596FD91|nr:hypothetical protein [Sphingomonas sp. HMP6]BCA57679.1 hypothetical protein HMP06_0448 [Sphingomonas sp. HMP6]
MAAALNTTGDTFYQSKVREITRRCLRERCEEKLATIDPLESSEAFAEFHLAASILLNLRNGGGRSIH